MSFLVCISGYLVPCVTRLVSVGILLEHFGVPLILLFGAHALIVDEAVVEIVKLVVEVNTHLRLVHVVVWVLLLLFLFVCLRKVAAVLLDRGKAVLKL